MRLFVVNAEFSLTQNKQFKNTTCQVGIPQRERNQHCNLTRKFGMNIGANPNKIDQEQMFCQAEEGFAHDRPKQKHSDCCVKVEEGGEIIENTCLMAM